MWRARWLGIPAVVWVGGIVWAVLLAIVVVMCRCGDAQNSKCVEVFTDAFKVGLGAFIAMLAQWSNKVFGDGGAPPTDSTSR